MIRPFLFWFRYFKTKPTDDGKMYDLRFQELVPDVECQYKRNPIAFLRWCMKKWPDYRWQIRSDEAGRVILEPIRNVSGKDFCAPFVLSVGWLNGTEPIDSEQCVFESIRALRNLP